jgi:hypothetical protein
MALFGRALSLIKQVHNALNAELADMNIAGLQSPSVGVDETVVNRWVRVLEVVSPPLINFGSEVRRLSAFAYNRRKSVQTIQFVMLVFIAVMFCIVAFSSAMLMNRDVRAHQHTMDVGALFAALIAFLGVVRCWMAVMGESWDRIVFQEKSRTFSDFQRLKQVLSDRMVVRYAAALSTGSGMRTLLDDIRDTSYEGGDKSPRTDGTSPRHIENEVGPINGEDAACRKAIPGFGTDCMIMIANCTSIENLPPLEVVVKHVVKNCSAQLQDMARYLQQIKLDVRKYDRPALWKCVASGVRDVRGLIEKQYDDASDVTREGARVAIMNEVLPYLQLRGAAIKAFKRKVPLTCVAQVAATQAAAAAAAATKKDEDAAAGAAECPIDNSAAKQEKTDDKGGVKACTMLQCWDKCLDDDTCVSATWECKSTCRLSTSYDHLSTDFDYTANTKDASAEQVLVRKPPPSSSGDAFYVCGIADRQALSQAELMPPSTQADVRNTRAWCTDNNECRVIFNEAGYKLTPEHMFATFLGGDAQAQPSQSNRALDTRPVEIYVNLFSDFDFRGVRTKLPSTSNPIVVTVSPSAHKLIVYEARALSMEVPAGVRVRVWRWWVPAAEPGEKVRSIHFADPTLTRTLPANNGGMLEFIGPKSVARMPDGFQGPLVMAVESSAPPTAGSDAAPEGPVRACIKTTPGQLYDFALQTGAAGTLRDSAENIARNVVAVLERYRFRIDLQKNRKLIDVELSKYYGQALYEKSVSAAIDNVLDRVQSLVSLARAAKKSQYVNGERFLIKLSTMTRNELEDHLRTLRDLRDCTKAHRDYFPAYHSVLSRRTLSIVFTYGSLVLGVGLGMYIVSNIQSFLNKVFDYESLVQRLILGGSIYVIVVAVFETMSAKYGAKLRHNHYTIDANGDALSAATVHAEKRFAELMAKLIEDPTVAESLTVVADKHGEIRKLAAGALASLKTAVESFDKCNTITAAQPKMPIPAAELVMYGAVILLFVAMAAVAWVRIDPVNKVGNIRRLVRIRKRLLRGEITINELDSIIACCAPESSVWGIFIWFTAITAVIVTVWFVRSSETIVDDYAAAIATDPDCI